MNKTLNKSQSKYFNTALKMDDAFLKLLDKKDFEYITIKEICDLAGVNRSTFYLHYETVNDILDESMDYINGKFLSYFEHLDIDFNNIDTLALEELHLITPTYLIPWIEFIKDNTRLFQTFLKRHDTLRISLSYEQILEKVIRPILSRYGVPAKNQEYMFLFYVEGIVGIIKHWLRNKCELSVNDVATLIMSCVKTPMISQ